LKTKTLIALLLLTLLTFLPARVPAASAAPVSCAYVRGVYSLMLSLKQLVKQLPKLTHKDAHNRAIGLLISEGHLNRRSHLLPMDFNRSFGSTLAFLEYATQFHTRKPNDNYNHYFNQTHRSLTGTWAAYRKHYRPMGCKGT